MRHTRRHRDCVISLYDMVLISKPKLERALEDDKDFINGFVQVQGRASSRLEHTVVGDAI